MPVLPSWGRGLLVGLLVLLLLLGGIYNEQVFAVLTPWWQKLLSSIGLGQQIAAAQQGVDHNVTHRSLPAAATYAALYVGICLLILRLLLRSRAQWQLTLRLYAGVAAVYVLLLLVGKLAHAEWAYLLSRRLIDFLASIIPVAALLVLFRAGFGPQDPPQQNAA